MNIHPDYGLKERAYRELLEAGAGHGGKGPRARSSWDSEGLAALAHQLQVISHDEYRAAMWRRRAWLHRHGRDGEVYDGTDALVWARELAKGTIGSDPFA